MNNKFFEFTIRTFWRDDKKYGDDLIEEIDFYDSLENMIKIVDPDLDDLGFWCGGYDLEKKPQIDYFEKKLKRKFDLNIYIYQFSRYDFEGKKIEQ